MNKDNIGDDKGDNKGNTGDKLDVLPIDKNSIINKTDLEMLETLFKDEGKVQSIMLVLKDLLIFGTLFFCLSTKFVTDLLKKITRSDDTNILIYKTIIFVLLCMFFRSRGLIIVNKN